MAGKKHLGGKEKQENMVKEMDSQGGGGQHWVISGQLYAYMMQSQDEA